MGFYISLASRLACVARSEFCVAWAPFFVLCALWAAGAAPAWESTIGIISDAKPEMRILWLCVASVACKITKLDREEGRATHRDEVASPSLLTYHLGDAWQGDTQNWWPSQWAHRQYPKKLYGRDGGENRGEDGVTSSASGSISMFGSMLRAGVLDHNLVALPVSIYTAWTTRPSPTSLHLGSFKRRRYTFLNPGCNTFVASTMIVIFTFV